MQVADKYLHMQRLSTLQMQNMIQLPQRLGGRNRFYWMREAQRLKQELERLEQILNEVENRAAFYRRQLRLESNLGMMLCRL